MRHLKLRTDYTALEKYEGSYWTNIQLARYVSLIDYTTEWKNGSNQENADGILRRPCERLVDSNVVNSIRIYLVKVSSRLTFYSTNNTKQNCDCCRSASIQRKNTKTSRKPTYHEDIRIEINYRCQTGLKLTAAIMIYIISEASGTPWK